MSTGCRFPQKESYVFLLKRWIPYVRSRIGFQSSLPHGKISLLIMVIGFIHYMMAGTVVNGCLFMTADVPLSLLPANSANDIDRNATFVDDNSSLLVPTRFGLSYYQVPLQNEFQCRSYWKEHPIASPIGRGITQEIFHDAYFQAARAFGMLSLSIFGIFILMLLALPCITFSRTAIKLLAFMSFLAGIFNCFTLLLFASELCDRFSCQVSIGSGMAIPVSILAIMNSVLIYRLPCAAAADNDDDDGCAVPTLLVPGTTDVSETVLPDGSKKIVKATVNQDGSITVEETLIQAEAPIVESYPTATSIRLDMEV
jgi:hypothetical protein